MNNKIVMEEVWPASTSLLDGFGDSCDLGADSMGTHWALHGREPQRAANKSRSRWGRAYRLIREYISFRAIAWRFLHKVEMTEREVEMTGRKTSTKIRQLYDTCRYPIGTCSQTALLFHRQMFDKSSTALRLSFDNDWKGCRRTVEEPWENPRRNVGAGIAQVISGYGRRWNASRRSVGESGLMPQLIPRAFLVYFSVFLAKRAKPALSLPKPCLSPTLALGKKHKLIGPFFGLFVSFQMILFCVCLAHARQSSSPEAAHGVALSTDSIKPLKIGDTIPEALWNMPLQMVKAGQEGSTAITLNDYRGKLIILDFWATWCSPCVAMLPKSDSLQNRYKKELQLLPVSSQTETEVLRLLNREVGVKLPSVVGDTVVKKFFPHFYLPHYVWIGADGKVKAITDHYRVTDRSVKEILGADVSGAWTAKRDKVLEFKRGETLWDAVKKGIRLPLLSEIIMTGHIDSLPGQYEIMQNANGGLYKIVMVNAPLVKLYSLALGGGEYIGNNRIRLETADSTLLMPRFKGDQLVEWARFNTYCFQASVPRADWRQAYIILYEQLNHHFPKYRVTLETVRQKVIALKTIPSFRKETLSTADGRSFSAFNAKGFELRNKPLSSLILRLNVLYQQHSPYPIVDGTGLTGNVSLKVDAKLADLNGLNRALEPHGLRFAEEERDIPMVIFRDR